MSPSELRREREASLRRQRKKREQADREYMEARGRVPPRAPPKFSSIAVGRGQWAINSAPDYYPPSDWDSAHRNGGL